MALSKSLLESKEINILSQDSARLLPPWVILVSICCSPKPPSGRSAGPLRPPLLSDRSSTSQLSIRRSPRCRQAFWPERARSLTQWSPPLPTHFSSDCRRDWSNPSLKEVHTPHSFLTVPGGTPSEGGLLKLHSVARMSPTLTPTPRKSVLFGGWLVGGR